MIGKVQTLPLVGVTGLANLTMNLYQFGIDRGLG